MLFERGIRAFTLVLILMVGTGWQAQATEIPTLTWERGKSQSVVLGGETESLGWNLYLEGEGGTSQSFRKSMRSNSGFYVFSIRLSRTLATGSYAVVSRDSKGVSTVVAGVQVVDRISYDIRQIPLDLFFLLILFIGFLSIQVSVRRWTLVSPEQPSMLGFKTNYLGFIRSLSLALHAQRRRWQSTWLGQELRTQGEVPLPVHLEAFAPVVALVIAIFASMQELTFPLVEVRQIMIVSLLALITFWDKYSAKLVFLTCFAVLLLFNSALNVPSLIAITLFLCLFLIPRYVGDVVATFMSTFGSKFSAAHLTSSFISSLAVGLSVFWVYLISESVVRAPETQASRATPIAVLLAVSQLLRTRRIHSSLTRGIDSRSQENHYQKPVVSLAVSTLVTLTCFGTILSWTTSVRIALLSSGIVFVSLITIFLRPSESWTKTNRLWRREQSWVYVCGVLLLTGLTVLFLHHLTETVTERSNLVFVFSFFPLLFLSLFRLFGSDVNRVEQK